MDFMYIMMFIEKHAENIGMLVGAIILIVITMNLKHLINDTKLNDVVTTYLFASTVIGSLWFWSSVFKWLFK